MDEMKFDMGGAGSVFGAIKAASLMKLPINIVGVIAAAKHAEWTSTKPGDVVTSMSGKTSKFSIPTPRVAWCCATHSPTCAILSRRGR